MHLVAISGELTLRTLVQFVIIWFPKAKRTIILHLVIQTNVSERFIEMAYPLENIAQRFTVLHSS